MAAGTTSDEEVADPNGKTVELFWAPGSTASLRMKEFVEKSGVRYESVNVEEDRQRLLELHANGIQSAAAVRVGDVYVSGTNLDQVARLIGVSYDRPAILSPSELVVRYGTVTDALGRFMSQLTPDLSSQRSPDQGRTILGLSYHAASVMRIFLRDFDREAWESDDYHADMHASRGKSDEVSGVDVALDRLEDTVFRFWNWWNQHGESDPMTRVVSIYWGHRTLQEALEREICHTAHHTRQIEALLRGAGVEPDRPLTARDLEGLPLPERLYA